MTPNYEILFFSSELYEVVNIMDFWDKEVKLMNVTNGVKNFVVGGESSRSEKLLEILLKCTA